MKIVVKKNKKKGKFYFRVLGGNNREMLRSGAYASKRNLAEAVAVLKAGFPDAKVVDEAA